MRLEVSGPDLPALLRNAALALSSQIIPASDVGQTLREKVSVEGDSPSALLQSWIETLLGLMSVQNMVFCDWRVKDFQEAGGRLSIRAELTGELRDPLRHSFTVPPQTIRCRQATVTVTQTGFTATIEL